MEEKYTTAGLLVHHGGGIVQRVRLIVVKHFQGAPGAQLAVGATLEDDFVLRLARAACPALGEGQHAASLGDDHGGGCESRENPSAPEVKTSKNSGSVARSGATAKAATGHGKAGVALARGEPTNRKKIANGREWTRMGPVDGFKPRRSHRKTFQSRITFPLSPTSSRRSPTFSNSSAPKRCVMTGEISSPLCSITLILNQVSYISRP